MSNFPEKLELSKKDIDRIWDLAHKEITELPVNVIRELGERESRALCFAKAFSKELYSRGLINFVADYEPSRGNK